MEIVTPHNPEARYSQKVTSAVLRGRPSETAQSVSGVQCTLFAPPLWPEIRPQ